MRFCWYTPEFSRCCNVLLVGAADGRVKNLSAWPGQRTPRRFRAATAAESALRLASDPGRRLWLSGVDCVTTAHYDTDSVLAVWAILHPEVALRHQTAVREAAAAAAFERFTSPRGVQFDLTVRAFEHLERSPLKTRLVGLDPESGWALLLKSLLELLPDALLQPESFRTLWEEEWQSIQRARALLQLGEAQVHESSGLSVIESGEPGHWKVWFAATRQDCVLVVRRIAGGWTYELRHRPETWYDLPGQRCGTRPDLTPLAQALNALEGEQRWQVVPGDYFALAGLYCGQRRERRLQPSRLAPEMAVEIIAGFLEPARLPQRQATGD